jgi:hypothetical protein
MYKENPHHCFVAAPRCAVQWRLACPIFDLSACTAFKQYPHERHVSVHRSPVKRRVSILVGGVWIRTCFKKQLSHLQVPLVRCQAQRCVSVARPCVHAGASLKQESSHGCLGHSCCFVERREPIATLHGIRVCPRVEKHSNDSLTTAARCIMKRSVAMAVGHILVGACLKEKAGHTVVSVYSSPMQRRIPVRPFGIFSRPCLQKNVDNSRMTILCG